MKKHSFPIYFLLFPLTLSLIPTSISFFSGLRPRKTPLTTIVEDSVFPKTFYKIRVMDTVTQTVSETELENYLIGVLAAEMPASYEPEALKAQAVAARSFIISKMYSVSDQHPDAHVCNNPNHCKAWLPESEFLEKWTPDDRTNYHKKIIDAVYSTRGEYMVYGDEIVEAFFFAGSGGKTESSEDVWGGSRPYLKSVKSEWDIHSPNYLSKVTISVEDFWSILKEFNPATVPTEGTPITDNITRTEGGSVATIILGGQQFTGREIRQLFNLKSANFTITTTSSTVTFSVLGYGHGVGMSQFGANYMAKNGKKYTEILHHYYTNIQIIKN